MFRLKNPVARAANLGILLGTIVFAGPSFAAPSDSSSGREVIAQASSSEGMGATTPASAKSEGESPVEAHIKELHKRLHITAAQDTQWNNLAEVMRTNAKTMRDLEKQRSKDTQSMSAVDVVKSYDSVIEAHEEGMKKFVPAFEAVYNSMSDEQKKTADELFRKRAHAAAKKETKANQ
jgi:periplasmic protein CpxP/Spy